MRYETFQKNTHKASTPASRGLRGSDGPAYDDQRIMRSTQIRNAQAARSWSLRQTCARRRTWRAAHTCTAASSPIGVSRAASRLPPRVTTHSCGLSPTPTGNVLHCATAAIEKRPTPHTAKPNPSSSDCGSRAGKHAGAERYTPPFFVLHDAEIHGPRARFPLTRRTRPLLLLRLASAAGRVDVPRVGRRSQAAGAAPRHSLHTFRLSTFVNKPSEHGGFLRATETLNKICAQRSPREGSIEAARYAKTSKGGG
ncbi:hypothetical protein MRX96_051631 [Rhipicephalus microplus]